MKTGVYLKMLIVWGLVSLFSWISLWEKGHKRHVLPALKCVFGLTEPLFRVFLLVKHLFFPEGKEASQSGDRWQPSCAANSIFSVTICSLLGEYPQNDRPQQVLKRWIFTLDDGVEFWWFGIRKVIPWLFSQAFASFSLHTRNGIELGHVQSTEKSLRTCLNSIPLLSRKKKTDTRTSMCTCLWSLWHTGWLTLIFPFLPSGD